jgi:radical SAM protein with 4Fe4S-binding SPASM domain
LACRYCYAGATPDIGEELLSIERLFEIIDEAADLGISTINVSGGEPFEHPKIFRIIERIVEKGIYPAISTKACLGNATVQRLANLGLQSMQVSLDSANPTISDYLVGREGHHCRVIGTIKRLIGNDIKVLVNAVITSYNIRTLPDLARLLEQLGVSEFWLAPYMHSLGRHEGELVPTEADTQWLRDKLVEIKAECPNLRVNSPLITPSSHVAGSEAQTTRMPSPRMYCGVGVHGFVLLPDGRVTVCERLIDGSRFIVGDLRSQSILEMWRSPEWNGLCAPEQSLYEGTACYSCSDFGSCTTQRRRCFISTLAAYGRAFGPEPSCPRVSAALQIATSVS